MARWNFDLSQNSHALRDVVGKHIAVHGGIWELRAQLCVDLQRMPIEDGSLEWPEELSPYVAVARIIVRPQLSWDEASSPAEDDQPAFSPWHGLQAHRPIGSIMRVRRHAYAMVSAFRHRFNADMQSPPAPP